MRRRTRPLEPNELSKLKSTDEFDVIILGEGATTENNCFEGNSGALLPSRWIKTHINLRRQTDQEASGQGAHSYQFQWSSATAEYLVKWPKAPLSRLLLSHELKATILASETLKDSEGRPSGTILPSLTQSALADEQARNEKEFIPIPQMFRFGSKSQNECECTPYNAADHSQDTTQLLIELFPQDMQQASQAKPTGSPRTTRRMKLGGFRSNNERSTASSFTEARRPHLTRAEAEASVDSMFSFSQEQLGQMSWRHQVTEILHNEDTGNSTDPPDLQKIQFSQMRANDTGFAQPDASTTREWERWVILLERITFLLQDITKNLYLPAESAVSGDTKKDSQKPYRRPKAAGQGGPSEPTHVVASSDPFSYTSVQGLNTFAHRFALPQAIPIELVNHAMQSGEDIFSGLLSKEKSDIASVQCPLFIYQQWLLWRLNGADVWRPWGLPLIPTYFCATDIDAYFLPAALGQGANAEDDVLLKPLRDRVRILEGTNGLMPSPSNSASLGAPLYHLLGPSLKDLVYSISEKDSRKQGEGKVISNSPDFAIRTHLVPHTVSLLTTRKNAHAAGDMLSHFGAAATRIKKRFNELLQREGLSSRCTIADYAHLVSNALEVNKSSTVDNTTSGLQSKVLAPMVVSPPTESEEKVSEANSSLLRLLKPPKRTRLDETSLGVVESIATKLRRAEVCANILFEQHSCDGEGIPFTSFQYLTGYREGHEATEVRAIGHHSALCPKGHHGISMAPKEAVADDLAMAKRPAFDFWVRSVMDLSVMDRSGKVSDNFSQHHLRWRKTPEEVEDYSFLDSPLTSSD